MSSISAGTSAGTALVSTGDTTGQLVLKTNTNTAALTLAASGDASFIGDLSIAGSITSDASFLNNVSVAGSITSDSIAVNNISISGTMTGSFINYDSSFTLSSSPGTDTGFDLQAVVLTSTTEIIFIGGNASIHAVVWDNTTKTFGTPVLIRTATNLNYAAVGVSSTTVLFCSLPSVSTALQVVTLSISGTTITVNTVVPVTLAANAYMSTVPQLGRLVQVGTSYIICYKETVTLANTNYRAITVSGTVPTVGAQVTDVSGTSTTLNIAYNSSTLLSASISSATLFVQAISVSGTTLTIGSAATRTINTSTGFGLGQLSSGRVFIAYTNSGYFGALASIAGTVVTLTAGITTGLTSGSAQLQTVGNQVFLSTANATGGVTVFTDTAGVLSVGSAATDATYQMFGFDGTNLYCTLYSTNAGPVYAFNIVSGSPNLNNFWRGAATSIAYGNYNVNYANINTGLSTVSGKYSGGGGTQFATTFNTTDGVVMTFSPSVGSAGIFGNINSALNTNSAFSFSSAKGLPTKVIARRTELI